MAQETEFGFSGGVSEESDDEPQQQQEPLVGGASGLSARDTPTLHLRSDAIGTMHLPPPAATAVQTETVHALDDFYHGAISQEAAHGLLIGAEGGVSGKAGWFLVWEGPKKGQTILTLVTNDEEIQDNIITRDDDGELLMNGEETGHDEILVCIQAFQTMYGFRSMHLERWGDRPLLRNPVAKVDKKGLKDSKKAFKSFRKSVRQAEKASRRMSKRRGSRRGSGSQEEVIVEMVYDTKPEPEEEQGLHPELALRRRSLNSVDMQAAQNAVEFVDPAEEWVQGSLFGRLQDPARRDITQREAAAPESPEVAQHNVYSQRSGMDATPIHRWNRDQAAQALADHGNRDGDFVVRWSDKVKNGYVITSCHSGVVTNSSVTYVGGQYLFGPESIGSTVDEAIDALCTVKKISRQGGRPYHLVRYDRPIPSSDSDAQSLSIPAVATDDKAQRGFQQPYHPKTHILGADANDGAVDVNHRRVANAPKHTYDHPDRLVRSYPSHAYTGGKNEERVANAEVLPRVNEQARGAPETLGKSNVGGDSFEIQHVKTQGNKAARAPQALMEGAMSRDKKADVSWASRPLEEGEKHEVVEAPGTLSFEGNKNAFQLVEPLPGHQEDFSPFFFAQMYTKDDAEALLQMVGENGAFLLRPDKDLGNLKFTLSVRIKGKVTHHLLFRERPGLPFTVCCMPFAVSNEFLGYGQDKCLTLLDVVRHLMVPRPYWPQPLTSGVPCPTDEAEFADMMAQITEYKLYRGDERANKAQASSATSNAAAPRELTAEVNATGGRRVRSNDPPPARAASPTKKVVKTTKKVKVKKTVKVPKKKQGGGENGGSSVAAVASSGEVSYNHGGIGAKEAEALILADDGAKVTGKFLLRSKTNGSLVVSTIFKGKATHHTAELTNGEFVINGKLSSGASTDADLIAFLRSKHKGWPLELTEGVPASSSGGGGGAGSGARTLVKPSYYHGAIKKLDTEELLTADNGAKQAGKFLIRSKSESDNDYIVSVIFKGKVTHHAVSRPGAGDTFTVNGKLETTATDLDGLVEFLRSKHKGWPLELTEGVVNEERSEYSAPAESAAASAPSGSGAEEFTDEEIEVEEEVEVEEVVEVAAPKQSKKGEAAPAPVVKYTVTVASGDRVGPSQASIVLHGMVGDSEPLVFTGKKATDAAFSPNTEKEFAFEIADVGPVSKITLTTTGGGEGAWDVSRIDVDRLDENAKGSNRHSRTHFSCGATIGGDAEATQTFEADSDAELQSLKAAWADRSDVHTRAIAMASAQASKSHVARANLRIDGETTHDYDDTAREVQRQRQMSEMTHGAKRDKGIARGASDKANVDLQALHVQHIMSAPKGNTHYNPLLNASKNAEADARHSDKNEEDIDALIAQSKAYDDRGDHWQQVAGVAQ